jgi:hypothetical protein
MGAAGRKRCLELFAWPQVIKRHVALWESLAENDLPPAELERLRRAAHPLAMDFAASFRGHFSQVFDARTASRKTFCRTRAGEALYQGLLPPLQYAGLEFMLDQEVLRRVLVAARKQISGTDLLKAAEQGLPSTLRPDLRAERASFAVLWCLKQGYLE